MNNLDSNKYISLKAAGALYGYTRDHLGLMIRKGKLKGTRIGSYYVTTGEWMVDYIKNFSDPNHSMSRNKMSNKFLAGILSAKKDAPLVARIENIKSDLSEMTISNINNDLGEKILKELEQYATMADEKMPGNNISQPENIISTLSDAQYAILPIRKMEDAEREGILDELDLVG
ncbi:MAG: hypothetical protein Q7J30_01400 [Candidatus Azambacteria bacterium]|nr:hypothetical protein [Candidatus Azambacteria bacterium]